MGNRYIHTKASHQRMLDYLKQQKEETIPIEIRNKRDEFILMHRIEVLNTTFFTELDRLHAELAALRERMRNNG